MIQTILSGLLLGFASSTSCPSNGEQLRLGSRWGFRLAAAVGLGAFAGDVVWLLLVAAGVMPLLNAHPAAELTLWALGGVVLLLTGRRIVQSARSEDPLHDTEAVEDGTGPAAAFASGFMLTTLNPYSGIWWTGMLSVGASLGSATGLPVFAAAALAGVLLWFLLLAGVVHGARHLLHGRPRRWLLTGSGLLIAAYGGYLLIRAAGIVPSE